MKRVLLFLLSVLAICGFFRPAFAQVLFSSGTYSQNFDTLANSGTNNQWIDNVTLPGWYASKTVGTNISVYRGDNGGGNAGALYSFGSTSSAERALGSICSGPQGNISYGIRFLNDAPSIVQSNIVVSYTGEQWRNGGNTNAHKLGFFYRVGTAITNADASNSASWIAFTNLDFITPTIGSSASALDGNNPTNQTVFTSVELPTVTVLPGQELFLRWYDVDDQGGDHGFAIDNLTVTFAGAAVDARPPSIVAPPQSQTVAQGSNVTFTVAADGAAPLNFQWKLEGNNLSTATKSFLSLTNVSGVDAGTYTVIVSNAYGFTNASALLTIAPQATNPPSVGFSLMTYNVKGNGATNWATNSLQVQAIGREVMYLQPDVITFNEIPRDYTYEMTNFIKAFLPGYYMATNSGTDGFIRSVIASRYPITRSSKWLDGADLNPFGYTNANFTRDLFEAQINVPNFSRPLHVFVTHLKSSSGDYADAVARRAAEAAAITNFFATNFFVLYPNDPYTLSGDMNESDTNALALQELVSAPTGLHLTNPKNSVTGSINTYSIQASVTERIDYIMPCNLLFSNMVSSQVFRSDRVTPLPADLLSTDSKTASDHLPVLMYFSNPYDIPYRITSVNLTNQVVTVNWLSMAGVQYRVDVSTNLTSWRPIRTNTAVSSGGSFTTNVLNVPQFFRIYRLP